MTTMYPRSFAPRVWLMTFVPAKRATSESNTGVASGDAISGLSVADHLVRRSGRLSLFDRNAMLYCSPMKFWENVQKTEYCWNYTKRKMKNGYARVTIGKRPNRKDQLAHRYSWELQYGMIPSGVLVCHHCDNRSCVRPSHLFLGSAADNSNDMLKKGRDRNKVFPGQANGSAKLTWAQVKKIRERKLTYKQITERYGIKHSQIHNILSGKCWK